MPIFASGRTTGLVLDVGDQVTSVAGFYEGYKIPESCCKVGRGGRDVTQFMSKLLKSTDLPLSSSSEF